MTVYSQELCALVTGYSNNIYRCCETIDEGNQALREFLARNAAAVSPAPTAQAIPGPAHRERCSGLAVPADDSWWCCFAGAEPRVYQGV